MGIANDIVAKSWRVGNAAPIPKTATTMVAKRHGFADGFAK